MDTTPLQPDDQNKKTIEPNKASDDVLDKELKEELSNKSYDPFAGELGSPKTSKNIPKIIFIIIFLFLLGAGIYYYIEQKNAPKISNGSGTATPTLTQTPEPDKNLDTDKDGLPDAIEKVLGTNPESADTDSDTYNDFNEVTHSHNPLVAGATDKYTPEEWLVIKEKIRSADEEFYKKNFETPSVSPSPAQIPAASLSPSPSPSVNQSPTAASTLIPTPSL